MLLPEIKSWKHWGEIFTDETVWTPVIEEICKVEGIDFNNISKGYPGTNAVFILDKSLVIKIYPPRCHEDYKKELEIHKELGKNEKILIPKIYYNGVFEDRIKWPYIIMEYKEGYAIRDVRHKIGRENLLEIYFQLGEIIKEFHSTKLANFTNKDFSFGDWKRFIGERIKECNQENTEIMKHITKIDPISTESNITLINADLTEDHLLLREENGKWYIESLIDLADGRAGVKDYEWIALWFGLLDRDIEGLKAFMKSYDPDIKLDEEFRNRAMIFTFLHQFGNEIIDVNFKKLNVEKNQSIEEMAKLMWFQC